jgi:hypothetical protein
MADLQFGTVGFAAAGRHADDGEFAAALPPVTSSRVQRRRTAGSWGFGEDLRAAL